MKPILNLESLNMGLKKKMNAIILPTDIWNKIWLSFVDEETLKNTRELQSDYVKKWTESFKMQDAAKHGNLGNLKWLLANKFCKNTFPSATAKHGNLEIMKWLLENNCPWNSYTFYQAAEYGNLENMKWLLENKCPWDIDSYSNAVRFGNSQVINWLQDNNCPMREEG